MHTYFNIHHLSVTMLRFFTVYGPMGALPLPPPPPKALL